MRIPETGDLWRLTMEHSPVGMALVSPDGDFLTANNALCDMLGHEPDVMATLTFQDITHPDDLAIDLRLVARVLAGEIDSYRITKRYIHANGSVVFGDLSVALLRTADGSPIHFISQIADVTERHAFADRLESAEEQTEVERRKAEAVFDTAAVGLLLLDADGNYQAFNKRLEGFLELAYPTGHGGLEGQEGFVLDAAQVHTLTRDEMPSVRAAAGEEFQDVLVWFGANPTARRALSISARSIRDRSGRFAGAVLAYHDVTELMRAIQAKDEFVTSVSHELRTPLTSALAHLELLESTDLSDEVRQRISAVRRNALRLSHLVADLLFTARATSGSPLIDPARVDLVTLVREALDSAHDDATAAGVALASAMPESLIMVADGLRLRQVADNLISNAITFTGSRSDGHVDVSLRDAEEGVELTVSDNGEGIDEADMSNMFGRFVRGQNALRRQIPGTGLGLNIVRTIVEAHGGEVSLESTRGVGTTVRLTLPR